MTHALLALPYAYDALEPHIDARTLEIHHDKHHAGYVKNLNAALEGHPELQSKTLEELLADLRAVPESIRTAVRNNGGGTANHNLFWLTMAPGGGGEPGGALAGAIGAAFGDFASFKETLSKTAAGHFASGWGWLAIDTKGNLKVFSTPGHDSPVMQGMTPLLVVDVWEHAYYLHYQNRRADFISAWWNVVNWAEVSRRFGKARG
jgi:Fe-Mn family superoxide dismutase